MTSARESPCSSRAWPASTDAPLLETTALPASCTGSSKWSTICVGAWGTTLPAAGSLRSRLACASAAAGKAAGTSRGSMIASARTPRMDKVDLLVSVDPATGAGVGRFSGRLGRPTAAMCADREASGGRGDGRRARRCGQAEEELHGGADGLAQVGDCPREGPVGGPDEARAEQSEGGVQRERAGLAGMCRAANGEQGDVGAAL